MAVCVCGWPRFHAGKLSLHSRGLGRLRNHNNAEVCKVLRAQRRHAVPQVLWKRRQIPDGLSIDPRSNKRMQHTHGHTHAIAREIGTTHDARTHALAHTTARTTTPRANRGADLALLVSILNTTPEQTKHRVRRTGTGYALRERMHAAAMWRPRTYSVTLRCRQRVWAFWNAVWVPK